MTTYILLFNLTEAGIKAAKDRRANSTVTHRSRNAQRASDSFASDRADVQPGQMGLHLRDLRLTATFSSGELCFCSGEVARERVGPSAARSCRRLIQMSHMCVICRRLWGA